MLIVNAEGMYGNQFICALDDPEEVLDEFVS